MLSINLKENEKIILEKYNIILTFNNEEKFYDVILTNQRILIYLNDFDYDPSTALPAVKIGHKIVWKDHHAEILREDILSKEGNTINLKNNQFLKIKDQKIMDLL